MPSGMAQESAESASKIWKRRKNGRLKKGWRLLLSFPAPAFLLCCEGGMQDVQCDKSRSPVRNKGSPNAAPRRGLQLFRLRRWPALAPRAPEPDEGQGRRCTVLLPPGMGGPGAMCDRCRQGHQHPLRDDDEEDPLPPLCRCHCQDWRVVGVMIRPRTVHKQKMRLQLPASG